MVDPQIGDISIIGITESGQISIEFYNPSNITDELYTTIFLTPKQAKTIMYFSKLLESINE